MLTNTLIIIGTLAVGLFLSYALLKGKKFIDLDKNKEKAASLIKSSEEEAEKIRTEVKAYVQKRKETITHQLAEKEERFKKMEEVLNNKQLLINKKEERNKNLKLEAASYQEETQVVQGSIKKMDEQILEQLTKISGKTTQKFKEELIEFYRAGVDQEAAERIARIEESLKESADRDAKRIVTTIIQRLCSTTSVETRAVNVAVPRDQQKGKIVGKDGVNIQRFEEILDVDVVFNDLPNTISISAFNLVQRRIAEKSMEKLVNVRGNVDKSVIEKCIKDAERETDEELYDLGLKSLNKIGIEHKDKEFIRIVGRLKYRTSYGQNIMKHSLEVGWLAAMLGSELGLDVTTCKVGGFLHDLGKAIDQDPNVKDAHDYLSKELMEKYGFSWEEVHAAWTHHDAIPQETPEAVIVKAADAISASRPGARQESFEKYLERMQALEETAESFEGVKKAQAMSAGREVRVNVDPEMISDEQTRGLAKNLAERIEEELTYPGQIKVNVIRRTKHTAVTTG